MPHLETGKQKLVEEAFRLHKAVLLSEVWLGHLERERQLEIPDYSTWPRRRIRDRVEELRTAFAEYFAAIVVDPDNSTTRRAVRWMADRLDDWQQRGAGVMILCTAQEFENEFGPLTVRKSIEVPPYANLLMQGLHSLAVRHPEYMLARDLELLYSLFLDAESLLAGIDWTRMPEWAGGASENGQSLARAVIQTCFNLLEAFISGTARAHLMETADVPDSMGKKLRSQDKSLRQRILSIPEVIVGRPCGLDVNRPPISVLFGSIKQARDSFVHCEAGREASARTGEIKEDLFYNVSKELVDQTVTLTENVIRHVWRFLYGSDGPRWLPSIDHRCSGQNLRLAPPI